MRRRALVALALLLMGAAPAAPLGQPGGGTDRHVILISIDGFAAFHFLGVTLPSATGRVLTEALE